MLLKSYQTEAGDVLELLYHGVKTAKVNPCTLQVQLVMEALGSSHMWGNNQTRKNVSVFKKDLREGVVYEKLSCVGVSKFTNNNFMSCFLWIGFTCLKAAESLRGNS